jgi:hypothetical protein
MSENPLHRLEIVHGTLDCLSDAAIAYAEFLHLHGAFGNADTCLNVAIRQLEKVSRLPITDQQTFIKKVADMYLHACGDYPHFYQNGYQKLSREK